MLSLVYRGSTRRVMPSYVITHAGCTTSRGARLITCETAVWFGTENFFRRLFLLLIKSFWGSLRVFIVALYSRKHLLVLAWKQTYLCTSEYFYCIMFLIFLHSLIYMCLFFSQDDYFNSCLFNTHNSRCEQILFLIINRCKKNPNHYTGIQCNRLSLHNISEIG